MPFIQHKNSRTITLLFGVFLLFLGACKITKNVPVGKQYLKKNEVLVAGDATQTAGLEGVIRQQPNTLFAGAIKFRLRVYNMIRAQKAKDKHDKKLNNWKTKNAKKMAKKYPKRIAKATRVNNRRIAKAKAKGETYYKTKYATLQDSLPRGYKDTLAMPDRLRERMKYKFGEPPVLVDTFLMSSTKEQMLAYLKAKGFFNASVQDTLILLKRYNGYNNRQQKKFDARQRRSNGGKVKPLKYRGDKVVARYSVKTGERNYIDSVIVVSEDARVEGLYLGAKGYLNSVEDKEGLNPLFKKALLDKQKVHIPYDAFALDAYRYELASFMLDRKLFGFTEQNVTYNIDTSDVNNHGPNKMILRIQFANRFLQVGSDSIQKVPFKEAKIAGVHFHIKDTLYEPNYAERLAKRGLVLDSLTGEVLTLDSLNFTLMKRDKKTKEYVLNPNRTATFHYNGQLFVRPELIESQNYLENDNYFKGYYVDRSYTRMRQLELFSSIKLDVKETYPGSGELKVDYYLVPSVRQNWSIKPKATTVNSLIGVSASASYSTINLRKSGTRLETSIGAGVEQNTEVFKDTTGTSRFFNTIEIGPQLSLSIPGIFPFAKVEKLGKRQVPKTIVTAGYNYQQRQEFTRNIIQFTYEYKFSSDKTQNFILGLPLASAIKIVSLNNVATSFQNRIDNLNDEFLKNTYRDQLIWEDFKLGYEFSNAQKDDKNPRLNTSVTASFAMAGFLTGALSKINPEYSSDGSRLLFGLPYAQFFKTDVKWITSYKMSRKHSIAYRVYGGLGAPVINSKTSMPFDYSFFGGGANDVRGWDARLLGPGTYLTYLDKNALQTQVGDIKLQSSFEYRFGSGFLNHAFFVDAGNIWTVKEDIKRPGSQFKLDQFYKQIALAAGYGLRLDFDFFILRVDVGVPIYHPGMPEGSKWVFEKRSAYFDAASAYYGEAEYKDALKKIGKFALAPYRPHFQIGIGLPF